MPSRGKSALFAWLLARGVLAGQDCVPGRLPDCDANGIPDPCETSGGPTFALLVEYPVGDIPHEVVAEDLDADGRIDIASTDRASDTVTVLHGDGSSTFRVSVTIPTPDEPRGIDAGDVDADGSNDLAVGCGNEDDAAGLPSVSIVLEIGDGTFAPRRDFTANAERAGALRSTTLEDVDADGDLDVVNGFSASDPGGTITLLKGDGRGTFDSPIVASAADPAYSRLRWAQYVAVGRIDRDVFADAVTFSGQLLRGEEGGFGPPEDFAEIKSPRGIALLDADRDGDLDAVITRSLEIVAASELLTFLNDGDQLVAFGEPVRLPGLVQSGIGTADIDMDGDADLALCFHDGSVTWLRNDGSGRFEETSERASLGPAIPRWIAARDVNGDGRPDLASPEEGGAVAVLLHVAGRDVDGDGVLDACSPPFQRGDASGEGHLNVADAIMILNHLFRGGTGPTCLEAWDADDNGSVELTDAIAILAYLFLGGDPLPPPRPDVDDCTAERGEAPFLGCEEYRGCR